MKHMALVALMVLATISSANDIPLYTKLSSSKIQQYVNFINKVNKPPINYAASKFGKHSVVIVGETHRRKEDAKFIRDLIPIAYHLYGVRHIVWEFSYFRTQEQINKLITGKVFDEKIMMKIAAEYSVSWLYKEYLAIYKTIWELNKNIPDSNKKIKLIAFSSTQNDFSLYVDKKQMLQDAMEKDKLMAKLVVDIVNKKEKVLVYCGSHHGFTKFHHPIHPDHPDKYATRGGNYIYNQLANDVFYVQLHRQSVKKWTFETKQWINGFLFPFNAVPTQIIEAYQLAPFNASSSIAIDTHYQELKDIHESNSFYTINIPKLRLSDLCDGYIMLSSLKNSQPVSAMSMEQLKLLPLDFYKKLDKSITSYQDMQREIKGLYWLIHKCKNFDCKNK